jgi:hypothetical protein
LKDVARTTSLAGWGGESIEIKGVVYDLKITKRGWLAGSLFRCFDSSLGSLGSLSLINNAA